MDHVEIRYGGSSGDGGKGAILVEGAGLTLTNGVIRDSYTNGIRIQTSSPTLTNNVFQNCAASALSMDLASNPDIDHVIELRS